jgi:hypothetical protein
VEIKKNLFINLIKIHQHILFAKKKINGKGKINIRILEIIFIRNLSNINQSIKRKNILNMLLLSFLSIFKTIKYL